MGGFSFVLIYAFFFEGLMEFKGGGGVLLLFQRGGLKNDFARKGGGRASQLVLNVTWAARSLVLRSYPPREHICPYFSVCAYVPPLLYKKVSSGAWGNLALFHKPSC
jgi:hypothetical protein